MLNSCRLAALVLAAFVSTPAAASPELARSKNCVACHHGERKMIGPAYKAIAERYANDAGAAITLAEKVRKGGGGQWGQSPMPPQASVSEEDADVLVRWILSHQ